jgi:hypothetical protein
VLVTYKFCSDLRETENVSFEISQGSPGTTAEADNDDELLSPSRTPSELRCLAMNLKGRRPAGTVLAVSGRLPRFAPTDNVVTTQALDARADGVTRYDTSSLVVLVEVSESPTVVIVVVRTVVGLRCETGHSHRYPTVKMKPNFI